MKKLSIATLALLFLTMCNLNAQNLLEQLEALPSVQKVETLDSGDFAEKYLLYFEQPIDHKHPKKGTFTQRVFVSNVSVDSS
ncbi:MAG: aminopeptidase, partial [Bacteroidales bacterium]|nr:aminopeptidase [Bacteroidales bacterium]